jgi:hypothetical protein
MKRCGGLRRALKWLGTAVCAIVGGMFALSIQRHVRWVSPGSRYGVEIVYGSFNCDWHVDSSAYLKLPRTYEVLFRPGWKVMRYGGRWRVQWWDTYAHLYAKNGVVHFPLWIPFLLAAIPTGFFWWRDRRGISSGHCQRCGYDLTGNVNGWCPECGTPIRHKGPAG